LNPRNGGRDFRGLGPRPVFVVASTLFTRGSINVLRWLEYARSGGLDRKNVAGLGAQKDANPVPSCR
jgi:hypothetical protein